jgi:hypothetical protein
MLLLTLAVLVGMLIAGMFTAMPEVIFCLLVVSAIWALALYEEFRFVFPKKNLQS